MLTYVSMKDVHSLDVYVMYVHALAFFISFRFVRPFEVPSAFFASIEKNFIDVLWGLKCFSFHRNEIYRSFGGSVSDFLLRSTEFMDRFRCRECSFQGSGRSKISKYFRSCTPKPPGCCRQIFWIFQKNTVSSMYCGLFQA